VQLDSNSYKLAWKLEREAADLYGEDPYQCTPKDFAEYMRRRKLEDADRRPGGKAEQTRRRQITRR